MNGDFTPAPTGREVTARITRAPSPAQPQPARDMGERFEQSMARKSKLMEPGGAFPAEGIGREPLPDALAPPPFISGGDSQAGGGKQGEEAETAPEAMAVGEGDRPAATRPTAAMPPFAEATGTTHDAELTAQFAERLALGALRSGDTSLALDPRYFRISEAVIRSEADQALSIELRARTGVDDGPEDGGEDASRLEMLRSRLEARAVPISRLAQTG